MFSTMLASIQLSLVECVRKGNLAVSCPRKALMSLNLDLPRSGIRSMLILEDPLTLANMATENLGEPAPLSIAPRRGLSCVACGGQIGGCSNLAINLVVKVRTLDTISHVILHRLNGKERVTGMRRLENYNFIQ